MMEIKDYEQIKEEAWEEVMGFKLNADYISGKAIDLYKRQASPEEAKRIFIEHAQEIKQFQKQLLKDAMEIQRQIEDRIKHKKSATDLYRQSRIIFYKRADERYSKKYGFELDGNYEGAGKALFDQD